jgi:hypothetical protein
MLGGKVKNLRMLYRLAREHGLRAPKLYPEPVQRQFELAYQFAVVMWIGLIIVVPPGVVLPPGKTGFPLTADSRRTLGRMPPGAASVTRRMTW